MLLPGSWQYARLNKGLAVVISPADAFKYTSFYKSVLEAESGENGIKEYDLCELICPLSKIKAVEVIDDLNEGEAAKLLLGDRDSLKSVAQELKSRHIKPVFEQVDENRFALSITR